MQGRLDLYRNVHKGIRMMMFDLIQKSGRLDFTDATALGEFRGEVRDIVELLTSHAHNEDTFKMPLLRKLSPTLHQELTEEHEDQEARLPRLVEMLEQLDPNDPEAADRGHAWSIQLSRLIGELLVHMADEEEKINPILWHGLTDEVLHQAEQQLVGSLPPEKLARYLTWMLPAMTHSERASFLGGIQQGAPEPLFRFIRQLASQVLTPAEDAKLETALLVAV
ncbi:MAG TPA: hemerythrin domain-containing protein [Thermoanaerobaculia bacterium]|jgi:hypothetical protein